VQKDLQQLRSQLDEERQAAAAREAETALLQARLARLHEIVLNSSRDLASSAGLPSRAALLMSQPSTSSATPTASQRPGLATGGQAIVPPLWSIGGAGGRAPWRVSQGAAGTAGGSGGVSSRGGAQADAVHWGPQTFSSIGPVRF
jgi:hypothetical protein